MKEKIQKSYTIKPLQPPSSLNAIPLHAPLTIPLSSMSMLSSPASSLMPLMTFPPWPITSFTLLRST